MLTEVKSTRKKIKRDIIFTIWGLCIFNLLLKAHSGIQHILPVLLLSNADMIDAMCVLCVDFKTAKILDVFFNNLGVNFSRNVFVLCGQLEIIWNFFFGSWCGEIKRFDFVMSTAVLFNLVQTKAFILK